MMMEMREFSDRPCVMELGVDTSSFYTNPAEFGLGMKAAGASNEDLERFGTILFERGRVFLSLGSPGRAHRDLKAAQELIGGQRNEVGAVLKEARKALEVVEAEERQQLNARRVPVTILTGFLGAGKTTLLNYILKANHGRKYAVIENEVGAIGIDNQLLEGPGLSERTTESVTLLDNGCLCCTVRSDLIAAVRQILLRADAVAANQSAIGGGPEPGGRVLDGILIETTGLADPGPVCKTFYAEDELRDRTRVDGVLTVVDAAHFLQQLQRERSDGAVNESAQQVAFADKILLNKVDAVEESVLKSVEEEIRRINAICPVLRCSLQKRPDEVPLDQLLTMESFSLDRVLRDMEEEAKQEAERAAKRRKTGHEHGHGHSEGHGHEHGHAASDDCCEDGHAGHSEGHGHGHGHAHEAFRHDTGVASCSFTIEGVPLVLQRFQPVMTAIRVEKSQDLYRYKGVVCIKEPSGSIRRAVLQGVHDMCQFEPRGDWPADLPPKSQIVFIGRKLDRALWGRLLERCKEGVLEE